MATVDVTRLRELHAAATAGEWHVTPLSLDYGIFSSAHECIAVVDGAEPCKREPNAAYIAAVHNALPAVLDALEQARAERDALAAELAQVRAQLDAVPSDYENSQAEERIRQIDRLFAHYGNDQHKWPQHARDSFARLDTAQRAYEAKYC